MASAFSTLGGEKHALAASTSKEAQEDYSPKKALDLTFSLHYNTANLS